MSKYETPLTRRYWQEIGGTLIEEFLAVKPGQDQGKRLLDGLVILGAPTVIARAHEVDLKNRDIVINSDKGRKAWHVSSGPGAFFTSFVDSL